MPPTRTAHAALISLVASAVGAAHALPVISEIMPNPAAVSDSAGEWFEVFNPGTVTIDLAGWHVADNAATHRIDTTSPLLLAPGAALVFARDDDPGSNGGIAVDYRYDGLLLSNSGDVLRLLDPGLVLVDEVVYTATFPFTAGVSMALVDPLADNGLVDAWRSSTQSYNTTDNGTPGQCNSDVGQSCTVVRAATGVPAPPTALLVSLGLLAVVVWGRRAGAGA